VETKFKGYCLIRFTEKNLITLDFDISKNNLFHKNFVNINDNSCHIIEGFSPKTKTIDDLKICLKNLI